ncbi:MAG: hypothetical protein ABI947_05490 [Chloroflexota bacterium]
MVWSRPVIPRRTWRSASRVRDSTALFVADLATYAVHFERLGWMTAYDVEPLITLETKRHWQQWAFDHDALILFQHDPHISAGRLVQDGERRRIEPVEVTIA